jgi:hypothetical protein
LSATDSGNFIDLDASGAQQGEVGDDNDSWCILPSDDGDYGVADANYRDSDALGWSTL